MDTKLTLKLNELIISQAKEYAKENKVSLSRLIEIYLASLTQDESKSPKITPLVESLSGVIDLSSKKGIENEYTEYLIEKYK